MSNLWLSKQGIWYFRKITTQSNGKRKEVKRSLRTRDKRLAQQKVYALLSCAVSKRTEPENEPEVIDFQSELKAYLSFKSLKVAEREILTIERFITRYLAYTSDPLSKQQAFKFLKTLNVSVPTKNKHASKIGAFFYWMDKHHDIHITNPFNGLKEKVMQSAKDQRKAYTTDQVKKLVRNLATLDLHKQWIIKIGLYTGMRCNEIVQLSESDVVKVNGIWCISVDDSYDWQSVKNESTKRLIPVHKELKYFVVYAKSKPTNARVFPEFKPYKGNCAHYFGKWFNRWRSNNDLPEFHSIRHYVATKLKVDGIPLQYTAALLGHSNGSITYDRYGKSITPDKLLDLVNRL
ncbi:site-specific integrase [Photobacterium sagamiensis]|uniref:site-specific integrase n=1 Tax=Photobacterium sagamiensis TaxID=2910241 RepID=UPI003D0FF561